MQIEKLDYEKRSRIYREHMLADFHREEVKPFERLEELQAQERYLCCGCYDGDLPVGYMYFTKVPDSRYFLLDYYAIFPEFRSMGYGSRILTAMRHGVPDLADFGKIMIAEVEDPAYSENAADKALRERRVRFYQRNGLRLLSLRSHVLGAHYVIMLLTEEKEGSPSEEAVAEALASIYRSVFGTDFCEKHIEITG